MLYGLDGSVLSSTVPPKVQRSLGGIRLPAPSELPRWQAWVERLWGGPNPHVSWLHLDWYDDEDVNRLVLWQVTPIEKCGPFAQELILGPPPGKDAFGRDNGVQMVRIQWELCQRLHGWCQVYWVIQGAKGGHKRRYTEIEQQLLKLAGLPPEAPVPGSLPYAPFDERVVALVAQRDEMLKWNLCQDFASRNWSQLDADEHAAVVDMRAKHLKWLEAQVDGVLDSVTRADLQDIPTSREVAPIDWDAATHELTHEGL